MASNQAHTDEINLLRGRQLALIQLLPADIAIQVLAAAPIDSEAELALVADLLQRRVLGDHVIQVLREGET